MYIADDSPIIRRRLVALIEELGRFEVVGVAKTGTEAIDGIAELRPAVLILDMVMPGEGGFASASWGQAVVDELAPVDLTVEKVAYSAFYASRLEFVLRRLSVNQLWVAGIVTNGGVASTVRDAHVRDLSTVVISDGCGAETTA